VVFAVNAVMMHQAGYIFYCSNNGVWLVNNVPQDFYLIFEKHSVHLYEKSEGLKPRPQVARSR
jgi:RNA:NAD 2'-phosphotransferase (TPT1/KptA family)